MPSPASQAWGNLNDSQRRQALSRMTDDQKQSLAQELGYDQAAEHEKAGFTTTQGSGPGFFDPHGGSFSVGDFFRGGGAGIGSLFHPARTTAGGGEPVVASGMAPGGMYPTTAATGRMSDLEANRQQQLEAQKGQAEQAKFIGEHPTYAAGSVVIPGLLLHRLGKAPGNVAAIMQDVAGAGREPVELARLSREARVKDVQDRYQQNLEDVRKENELRQAAAKAQTAAEKKDYIRQLQEHLRQKSIAETTAKAPDAVTRRQEVVADRVRQNAQDTFQRVKASLDARWANLRKTLGPLRMPKEPIANAIQEAENKYLMGSPESITIFKQLTRQLEEQPEGGTAVIEQPQGGAPSRLTPQVGTMPWEQARVFYTALGDKMYSGELPGNVKQAVSHVRDVLDRELSTTAKSAGKGDEYSGVKNDWGQFKQDWDNMGNLGYAKSAVGKSGSPLARLVRARTPEAALRAISDERLMSLLNKYKSFGADLENPRHIVALETAKGKIGKVKVPARPSEVQETIAKLREEPQEPNLPPDLSPEAIRRRRLLQFAGRPARPWDFVNPVHGLLKIDALREALAKFPRKEITPR